MNACPHGAGVLLIAAAVTAATVGAASSDDPAPEAAHREQEGRIAEDPTRVPNRTRSGSWPRSHYAAIGMAIVRPDG